jgi:phage shock protein E
MKETRFSQWISKVLMRLAAWVNPTAKAKEKAASATAPTETASAGASAQPEPVYRRISPAKAKQIIDSDPAALLVDVRELSEYASGHIPHALLLSLGKIEQHAADVLPDTDAQILVYCQSGMRSRRGAEKLLELGYTNILDMGGISAWPYEVVTE